MKVISSYSAPSKVKSLFFASADTMVCISASHLVFAHLAPNLTDWSEQKLPTTIHLASGIPNSGFAVMIGEDRYLYKFDLENSTVSQGSLVQMDFYEVPSDASLCWRKGGQYLFIVTRFMGYRIDVDLGHVVKFKVQETNANPPAAALSPTSERLLYAGPWLYDLDVSSMDAWAEEESDYGDGMLKTTGKKSSFYECTSGAVVSEIDFAADGRCLILVTTDGALLVVDLELKSIKSFRGLGYQFLGVKWIPGEDASAITVTYGGILQLWNLRGSFIDLEQPDHYRGVDQIGFDPVDSTITSSSSSGLKRWNLTIDRRGFEVREESFPVWINIGAGDFCHISEISDITPDGRRAVVSYSSTFFMGFPRAAMATWDFRERSWKRLECPEKFITYLEISADGRYLKAMSPKGPLEDFRQEWFWWDLEERKQCEQPPSRSKTLQPGTVAPTSLRVLYHDRQIDVLCADHGISLCTLTFDSNVYVALSLEILGTEIIVVGDSSGFVHFFQLSEEKHKKFS